VDLGVAIDFSPHQVVVGVHGEIDLATAPELRGILCGVLDRGHTNLVIDMSRLRFMDASGLEIIAHTSACLQAAGGQLTIRSPSAISRRILDISGLSGLIRLDRIHSTVDGLGHGQRSGDRSGLVAGSSTDTWRSPDRVVPGDEDALDTALSSLVARATEAVDGADGVSVALRKHPQLGTVAWSAGPRVLLVALEGMLAERTARQLRRYGYCVDIVHSEVEAMGSVRRSWPHLVVLDVRSFHQNDMALFEHLRSRSEVPIVMLSPLAEEDDRVQGLNRGADDFVPRPVSSRELAARVSAVLRRITRPLVEGDEDCLTAGPVAIYERARKVTVGGRPVALTALEYKLLCYLVRRPFQALDRATLLEEVWGYTIGDGSTITVHVRRLREKIETDPAAPLLIRTVWGLGYAFHPTFDDPPAVL
jgi:anti-anti-sigma factor